MDSWYSPSFSLLPCNHSPVPLKAFFMIVLHECHEKQPCKWPDQFLSQLWLSSCFRPNLLISIYFKPISIGDMQLLCLFILLLDFHSFSLTLVCYVNLMSCLLQFQKHIFLGGDAQAHTACSLFPIILRTPFFRGCQKWVVLTVCLCPLASATARSTYTTQ